MNRTLVIAEPGGTAEGNFGDMVELIHRAKDADADVFKAQWCSDPVAMCERRHITPEHPKREYYLRAYSWLAFPVEWHAKFASECEKLGLQYACTSFLPQDVATVDPFVAIHKIASFEAGNGVLLTAALATKKRVIASYGMSDGRLPSAHVNVLHCVTAYPAPIEEMNLAVLWPIEDVIFGTGQWFDGLSDHSRDLDMGGFAVCAGAKIVEAHFRLHSCSPENPDYATAFTPDEFAIYVQKIRKAERALGDGIKRVQPSEEWALSYKVTA